MKPKLRNALATLCLDHMRTIDPASLKLMRDLIEDNYKTGAPQWSHGHILAKWKEIYRNSKIIEVM